MATKPKSARTAAPMVDLPTLTPKIETLLKTSCSVAEKQLKAGWELTTGNVDKVTTHMMNNMNDASNTTTEMFGSTNQFYQTWAKGCEEIAKSYTSFCQSLMQDCMNTYKSMISAKSVQEAVSMQSDFCRSQFDKAMSESTRISEMCVKVATDATEPMQNQWTSMVNRYSKAA